MAKILLVEDDKSLREIYGVRLSAEGYEIVSAGDGEEALAMAIKERPDLIVSDVMMPKISGFDMLDILRSTSETKDVKVIMMTALSSDDQRARGEALGADRYLVKSQVGIEDVVRTVHDVLQDGIGASPTLSAPATPVAPAPAQVETPEPLPAPALVTVEPATPVTPLQTTPAPEPVATQPIEAFSPTPTPQPAQTFEPLSTPAPSAPLEPAAAPVFTPQPVVEPVAAPIAQPAPAPAPQPVAPTFSASPVSTTLSELPSAPAPAPVTQPTPAAAPGFAPDPSPVAVAPAEPIAAPQAQPFVPPTPGPSTPLPQPTAPFSSPAPASLGERVIQPLTMPTNDQADIAQQIEQALSGTPIPPAPGTQPPVPPTA